MHLNDLIERQGLDPRQVLVFRHRPTEPKLNNVLPWLAESRPDLFNAYQQVQGERLERVMANMQGDGTIAAFIGHAPAKAIFVGIYRIAGAQRVSRQEFLAIPAIKDLQPFGLASFSESDPAETALWFDLALTNYLAEWKGKLTVTWPPPERSWWRRAHRNEMRVLSILEESAFADSMPEWSEIRLSWDELRMLPARWRSALSHWRGVYYIFDTADGKAYVGSAGGASNLLGRWLDYAATGHGDNKRLRGRDPRNFRFSILQRVSPDMDTNELVELENSWKRRLHTHFPHGLNDN